VASESSLTRLRRPARWSTERTPGSAASSAATVGVQTKSAVAAIRRPETTAFTSAGVPSATTRPRASMTIRSAYASASSR